MKITNDQLLLKKIKRLLTLFIFLLLLSGLTAFPLESELFLLVKWSVHPPSFIKEWILSVHNALHETNIRYPFMAYGTDWLAFAHIVLAVVFIGPLRDPVKNIWVIQFGMIACVMVFPLALICGLIRGIPFYWQLIDCSFGVFGFIPLYLCRKYILQMEKINLKHNV
ncbi:MAG TPA: hypothetical protein VNZ49_08305 [Bacteroidia bacterium]|jgi:hypothetical protein|nr:hypothetical protein [Bacteroidia bacterium]